MAGNTAIVAINMHSFPTSGTFMELCLPRVEFYETEHNGARQD